MCVGARLNVFDPNSPDLGPLLQIGPSEPIAVAYFELMTQGLRRMIGDQLQRKFGHQVLKQLGDDLVTESRFDFPHVDDAFRWLLFGDIWITPERLRNRNLR